MGKKKAKTDLGTEGSVQDDAREKQMRELFGLRKPEGSGGAVLTRYCRCLTVGRLTLN